VTAAGPSPPVQLGCAGGAMVGSSELTRLHFIVLSDVARTGSRSAVRMVRIAFTLDCRDREAISWVTTTGGIGGGDIHDLMIESIVRRYGLVNRLPPPVDLFGQQGSSINPAGGICSILTRHGPPRGLPIRQASFSEGPSILPSCPELRFRRAQTRSRRDFRFHDTPVMPGADICERCSSLSD
jgi:hypothetical protein